MPAKRNSIDKCEPILLNVFDEVRNAQKRVPYVPFTVHEFINYVLQRSEKDVTPCDLAANMQITLIDINNNHCSIRKEYSSLEKYPIPKWLSSKRQCVGGYIKYVPLVIDKIENKKFARVFRKHFQYAFPETLPPVPNRKKNFGVTVLSDGGIDVSHKDPVEVLSKLYEYACPYGSVAKEYRSGGLQIQTAKDILQHETYIYLLFGRYMQIELSDKVIHPEVYNAWNGQKSAELAIAQCKDIM